MSNHTQERLEECVDEDLNFTECPECGYDDSDTNQGIAMHYGYNHEGSIGYLFRCEYCEELHFGEGQKNRFCSQECETLNRTGTLKHKDEEFLREEVEYKGKTVTDIADELDIAMKTVAKWVLEYAIGNEYECPSCDRSFATKQSVSKHHYDAHGESIAGTYYECEYCGEEFWDMKCESNHITPQYCSMECRKTGSESINHELTGHNLDSTWEKEVDKLLYKSSLDYEYESGVFNINDTTHKPDFISKQWILEVKSAGGYRDKERWDMIGEYLKEVEEREYIILGEGVDMPCNDFVEWSNRHDIISILSKYDEP